MQMRALVLQGFPTTSTLQSSLATSFSACPCIQARKLPHQDEISL